MLRTSGADSSSDSPSTTMSSIIARGVILLAPSRHPENCDPSLRIGTPQDHRLIAYAASASTVSDGLHPCTIRSKELLARAACRLAHVSAQRTAQQCAAVVRSRRRSCRPGNPAAAAEQLRAPPIGRDHGQSGRHRSMTTLGEASTTTSTGEHVRTPQHGVDVAAFAQQLDHRSTQRLNLRLQHRAAGHRRQYEIEPERPRRRAAASISKEILLRTSRPAATTVGLALEGCVVKTVAKIDAAL
jgi:hypothetical protein